MIDDKINVTCSICNCLISISKYTYSKKKNKSWKCRKCLAKEAKEKYKNLSAEEKERRAKISSERMRSYWNKMDNNEKEKRLNLLNDGFKTYNELLSKDDKNKIKEERRKTMKQYWNSIDSKRKSEILKPMKEGFVKWYNGLSDNDKLDFHKYIQNGNKQWWDNISDEERKRISKIRSESSNKYWKNISDEERKLISERQSLQIKQYWDNMTEEEYKEWDNKRSKGFNKYMDNLNYMINKNEMSLINYLKINNINYELHWYNKIKHIDFDKLFPNNPVTDSKHVSPYHAWDFKLNLSDNIVLVDIDGSIHNVNKITHEITYFNGKKIKLSDIIQFNDSQRPYQTDGLDAYIIQCYDDNLNNDTKVLNIKTNEIITFKSFISILIWINMSDKEKEFFINEII